MYLTLGRLLALAVVAGQGLPNANPPPLSGPRAEAVEAALAGMRLRDDALAEISGLLRQDVWYSPLSVELALLRESRGPTVVSPEGVAARRQAVVRFLVRPGRYRFETLALNGPPLTWFGKDGFEGGLPDVAQTRDVETMPAGRPPLYVLCGDGQERRAYNGRLCLMEVSQDRPGPSSLPELMFQGSHEPAHRWWREFQEYWERADLGHYDLVDRTIETLPVASPSGFYREQDDQIQGVACLRLVRLATTPRSWVFYRLWVAPALGYAVVRFDDVGLNFLNGRTVSQGFGTFGLAGSFVEQPGGLGLPGMTMTATYQWSVREEKRWREVVVNQFEDCHLAPPEVPGEFAFEPPLGTTVANHLTTKVYVAGVGPYLWRHLSGPAPPQLDTSHLERPRREEDGP